MHLFISSKTACRILFLDMIYRRSTMKAYCLILLVLVKSSFVFSDSYTVFSVHLVNGTSPNEGRVEVTVIAEDGTLTGVMSSDENYYSIDAANWVCNELKYPGAAFCFPGSRFGFGQPQNVFSFDYDEKTVDLECDFGESSACSDEEAAGVICHKPGYLGCFHITGNNRDVRIREMNGISQNDDCLVLCQEAVFAAHRDQMCFCFNETSILNDMHNEYGGDKRCDGNNRQLCEGLGKDFFKVFNVTAGFCEEISGVNLNVNGRFRFGDIVRANCSGGQRLMGDDVLQCIRGTDGPDVFIWNGTVPMCINATAVQPGTTNSPQTELTGITTTRVRPTGTGVEVITVQVTLSVVGVLIVAVLAILLVLYIIRTRKPQSEMKQNIQATSPNSKFDNLSYSMQTIPNNEEPSYYKDGQNAVTEGTEGTGGLIDNVLYKPADNVRIDPNEYELDQASPQNPTQYGLIDNVLYKPADDVRRGPNQYEHDHSSPNGTPYYGLIDNVLYKPAASTDDPHNHASNNFRQLPNGYDLSTNDSEYAFPDEHGSTGGHPEGELIDNILYKTSDNKVQNATAASRKYYEINPEPASGDYAGADSPIQDNIVQNRRRYYEIEPQSSHSPPRSNAAGYDPVHEADDDAYEPGPRFVIRADNTSSASHGYTAVVDNVEGFPSNVASNNAASAAADVVAVGGKPFPRYAKVQKSRKTEM